MKGRWCVEVRGWQCAAIQLQAVGSHAKPRVWQCREARADVQFGVWQVLSDPHDVLLLQPINILLLWQVLSDPHDVPSSRLACPVAHSSSLLEGQLRALADRTLSGAERDRLVSRLHRPIPAPSRANGIRESRLAQSRVPGPRTQRCQVPN